MNIIKQVIEELTNISSKIQELQRENTLLSKSEAQLTKTLRYRNAEVSSLNALIQERNDNIEVLEDDIDILSDKISKRDATISRLKQENERYAWRILELSNDRSAQDRLISSQNKVLNAYRECSNRTK